MLEKREFEKNEFFWRMFTAVTVVSGLFSLVVFILLVVNYLQIRAADPVNNEMITQMRQHYAALPDKDEALAQRIRDLDLLTRKAFFVSQEHLRLGAIMLLVGVSVFLISFKNMVRWRPNLPELAETPTAEIEFLAFAQSRQLLTWLGIALLGGGVLASLMTESILKSSAATVSEPVAQAPDEEPAQADLVAAPAKEFPPWETVELNWPTFRGPGALGVAHFTKAPMEWDGETGKGIRWKVEAPRAGTNSPVVWGNRLFMSGADEEAREVYCYDTETGDLLWTRTLEAFSTASKEVPQTTEETGLAAPTMAVHGEQVFAIFANGDIVSYDFDGEFLWGRNLGVPNNHYGHSSSLLAYESLLYVQYDQTNAAKLMALDVATGKETWVGARKKISWASPVLAHTPFGVQLILNSEEDVDAYNPTTGKLIWSLTCLGGEVAPSPAYSNGIVFVANEYAVGSAIQLSGTEGGVQSEVLWDWDELLPEVSSPVGDGERFYFATSMGELVSLEAKTGKELWIEEVDIGFYASPILVGDRIYILDMEGTMFIFRAGSEYELLASPTLGEGTLATPAFMDGRIYIRSAENLYCIE